MSTLTDRLFEDGNDETFDPFAVFEEWFALARQSEPNDPHAMSVASVDVHGMPDVRVVLLNARDPRGFTFYTNFNSAKGEQLLAHPKAAMAMHWKSLRRQVRARGPVEVVDDAESDAYFASRARGSQIASSVSEQSHPLKSRQDMVNRVEDLTKALGSSPVPRPPHWQGFRIVPLAIEFWKDGAFRMHDRMLFTRTAPSGAWSRTRLFP